MSSAGQCHYGHPHPKRLAGCCRPIVRVGVERNIHKVIELKVMHRRPAQTIKSNPFWLNAQRLKAARNQRARLPVGEATRL
jgi:hypothetical protein